MRFAEGRGLRTTVFVCCAGRGVRTVGCYRLFCSFGSSNRFVFEFVFADGVRGGFLFRR